MAMPTDDENREFARSFVDPFNWIARSATAWTCARPIRRIYENACSHADKTGDFNHFLGTGAFYLMLCGNAMEAALKGMMMLHHGPSFLDEHGRLRKEKVAELSHDLAALSDRFPGMFTHEEREICKILQEFVIWAGRYHLPKNPIILEKVILGSVSTEVIPSNYRGMTDRHADILEMLLKVIRNFSDDKETIKSLGFIE